MCEAQKFLSSINDSTAIEAVDDLDKSLFACVGFPKFGQIAFPFILPFQFLQKMVDLPQI
jgi:hypothetical protein